MSEWHDIDQALEINSFVPFNLMVLMAVDQDIGHVVKDQQFEFIKGVICKAFVCLLMALLQVGLDSG